MNINFFSFVCNLDSLIKLFIFIGWLDLVDLNDLKMHHIALTKEGVEYEWLELHKWLLSQLRGQNIVQQYKK